MRPAPPRSTLFPYTTLFRSDRAAGVDNRLAAHAVAGVEQHAQADRHAFIGELGDGLRDVVFEDLEVRSEEHTSELQSQSNIVCRLLLEKKKDRCILLNEMKK